MGTGVGMDLCGKVTGDSSVLSDMTCFDMLVSTAGWEMRFFFLERRRLRSISKSQVYFPMYHSRNNRSKGDNKAS